MRLTLSFKIRDEDLQMLRPILEFGHSSQRVIKRARTLWHLYERKHSLSEIAALTHISYSTVRRIRQNYIKHGLHFALYEKARSGKPLLLNADQISRILKLLESTPPAGKTSWSVRLLAKQVVKLHITPAISKEKIRLLIKAARENSP